MSQAYLEDDGHSSSSYQHKLKAQHNHNPRHHINDPHVSTQHNNNHLRSGPQHDASYYQNCLVGGVLSSSIRWVLTPLDAVKCNMQVHPHKYPNFTGGLQMVFRQEGFRGLYRGFIPTVLSYSCQTGTKYMMYEWFKDHFNEMVGDEHAQAYKSLIYIAAAGSAEAIADVLMCPWETLKVQMQTSNSHPSASPPRLIPSMVSLFQRPQQLMSSLPPLWSRQIAGTMANFLTFEHSANFIYRNILEGRKEDYSTSAQLTVTFCAGYVSGLVSTIVSHPADSLISLKGKYPDASIQELIQLVGWRNLATNGLGPRIALTGSIIGFQWFAYDTFKTTMGMGTTGG
jgi:solute carrier family 25 phosphate transporter 3